MALSRKCLVLSAHDGLIDRRIIAQINALAHSGREVTLVSVPAEGRHSLLPQVRVVMAGEESESGVGPLRRLARRLPTPIKSCLRTLAWRVGAKPLNHFAAYFEAITPRETFDVIHCHDLQTLPSGLRIRSQLPRPAKVIYDSHELFPYQFPPGRLRDYWISIESRYIASANAVITVNESLAGRLAKQYEVSTPLVLYNSCNLDVEGISRQAFHKHFEHSGGPPDAFRILFQGSFAPEKNVESLALAFERLGPAFQLFLLGGGALESRLRLLARRNASQNIHFGPWVGAECLLGYVAHAHAGIIPYLDKSLPNNHFCTPNKLFEYLQAGVPICAGDLPELRRIVQGEGLGRVYRMYTASEIASAIADFAVRCRAGEFNAGDFVAAREKYSWNRQAQKLLHLYQKLGV